MCNVQGVDYVMHKFAVCILNGFMVQGVKCVLQRVFREYFTSKWSVNIGDSDINSGLSLSNQ